MDKTALIKLPADIVSAGIHKIMNRIASVFLAALLRGSSLKQVRQAPEI
jgi:hypothetical protein